MAAKEAIVIILDVGKSMTTGSTERLEGAIKAVSLLVQQKLLYSSKDEIGLVLLGTKDSSNNLSESGYEHITTIREILIPDLEFLRQIDKIGPGGASADIIDGLIVGMDLLMHKTIGKKYGKRIFLVTDAASPTNQDDIPVVLQQFKKLETSLNVIGIDFEDESDDNESSTSSHTKKSKTKIANEKMLRSFAEEIKGVVVCCKQALEIMSWFRSKSVLQRTSFRGCLEISSNFSIPVWAYLKTMERKFPTLSKISVVSERSGNLGTMGVRLQRTYHSLLDPDEEIEFDQRLKAYKYGRTLVPFSSVDESILKYTAKKCLKVIGFTRLSNIHRPSFMSNVECIIPLPGDKNASVALSALIHALAETESAAIVRFVKREKAAPHLGVLLPHIKADFESLLYNKLPFAEDIRQYNFASLDPARARHSIIPSKEQLAAAENLISSLDLMNKEYSEQMEALKPKHTFNPVLQHFYQCVQKRAFNKHASLPKLDPLIEKYVNPDEQLLEKSENSLIEFKIQFPLTKTELEEKTTKKRFWRDALLGMDDAIKLDSYVPDPKKKRATDKDQISIDKLITGGTNEVGSINPVQDFHEMLSRRDVDLVEKAIQQMQDRINQLVNDSIRSQLYPKAIECLCALHNGCQKEDEWEEFNKFLRKIRSLYEGRRRADFWNLVVQKAITLIHQGECEDSTVTVDEAKAFLSKSDTSDAKPKTLATKENADDLFDMIE